MNTLLCDNATRAQENRIMVVAKANWDKDDWRIRNGACLKGKQNWLQATIQLHRHTGTRPFHES